RRTVSPRSCAPRRRRAGAAPRCRSRTRQGRARRAARGRGVSPRRCPPAQRACEPRASRPPAVRPWHRRRPGHFRSGLIRSPAGLLQLPCLLRPSSYPHRLRRTATRICCGAQERDETTPPINCLSDAKIEAFYKILPVLNHFRACMERYPLPHPWSGRMLLSRFSTDVSVRSRLIVLSLIPVIGFAAIALAYLSSERAVDTAFGSVQQSSRLSE